MQEHTQAHSAPLPFPVTDTPSATDSEPEKPQTEVVSPGMSDTSDRKPADSVGQRPTTSDTSVGHEEEMSDSVGQEPSVVSDKRAGHDVDLPEKSERHTLSTYEAGRMFEDAQCRVSERTIIRWCNKNKQGKRRLDCAFDSGDRKYFISEDSVKAAISEERRGGRQSDIFESDLSGVDDLSDTSDRQSADSVGQRPTTSDTSVGHEEEMSHSVGQETSVVSDASEQHDEGDNQELVDEIYELKLELAKREEQARTKDEMMTFLRQEIDRRGEQLEKDREVYESSMSWFRSQLEAKDAAIERLNTEVRVMLEPPRNDSPDATEAESKIG